MSELVVQFVAKEAGLSPEKIKAHSRLREDLHVDGDDAYDLLTAFSKRFHVQGENLVLADHFGPEGSGLLAFLFWRKKLLLPITIQDLIDSAAVGVWQIRAQEQKAASPP